MGLVKAMILVVKLRLLDDIGSMVYRIIIDAANVSTRWYQFYRALFLNFLLFVNKSSLAANNLEINK